jgi:aspartate/methionine/tyrosine aminotransferase
VSDALHKARALFLDGTGHFDAGRLEAAAASFEAARALAPERPSILANLGVTLLRLGRFADALGHLEASLAADPGQWFPANPARNVDLAPLGLTDDAAFCRRLVAEAGVAAIPVSAFYADASMRSVIRFCFAKADGTLDGAVARLTQAAPRLVS